jgi:hydrogenase maturation protease
MADMTAELSAVIGCGNPNRSDDGVGFHVIRRLAARAGPRVVLLDAGTDGMAVMFGARGCSSLIIVDACTTGGEPGAMFELPAHALAVPHPPSFTLHDFRWDHALYAGRKMFGSAFPTDVTVLLIEARSVALGLGLSDEVTAAAAKAVARIEQLLVQRRACS